MEEGIILGMNMANLPPVTSLADLIASVLGIVTGGVIAWAVIRFLY